jgi:hypothetical protein
MIRGLFHKPCELRMAVKGLSADETVFAPCWSRRKRPQFRVARRSGWFIARDVSTKMLRLVHTTFAAAAQTRQKPPQPPVWALHGASFAPRRLPLCLSPLAPRFLTRHGGLLEIPEAGRLAAPPSGLYKISEPCGSKAVFFNRGSLVRWRGQKPPRDQQPLHGLRQKNC